MRSTRWTNSISIVIAAVAAIALAVAHPAAAAPESTGVIQVRLFADGAPYPIARLWVHHGGGGHEFVEMQPVERGVWEAGVPGGAYDIKVLSDIAGYEEQWLRWVNIAAGTTVAKKLDMGDTGLLRVALTADGKPTDAGAVYMYLQGGLMWRQLRRIERGVFELKVPAGAHDIEVVPEAAGAAKQRVRGVEVAGGAVVEHSFDLGGSGVIRVRLIAGDKPFDGATVWVYIEGDSWNWLQLARVEPGVFELRVPAGVHDLEAQGNALGAAKLVVRGVQVTAGDTVERVIDMDGPQ